MAHARGQHGLSERHACRLLGQWRGSALAGQYGRYGSRRITALLRRAGWRVGTERVHHVWSDDCVSATTHDRELRQWLAALGAQTRYIAPGSPWENGYCESFNGTLRDECVNGEIFYALKEAQAAITPSSLLTQVHSPWL